MPSRVNHGMTWYQPCNLIPCRSSVQSPFWAVGCRRVITISFVLQWLCGRTSWPRCRVSLWHTADFWMEEFGKRHQWNKAKGHCYCWRRWGRRCTRQQARRAQADLTSNDPRNVPKIHWTKSECLTCLFYVLNVFCITKPLHAALLTWTKWFGLFMAQLCLRGASTFSNGFEMGLLRKQNRLHLLSAVMMNVVGPASCTNGLSITYLT